LRKVANDASGSREDLAPRFAASLNSQYSLQFI
jgi:hypothetical protein